MATILTKSARQVAVFAPREYLMRPFDFDSDWTEVQLGIFWCLIAGTGTDSQPSSETVVVSTPIQRVAFGIKSETDDIPGTAGTNFLGVMTRTQSVFIQGNQFGPTSELRDSTGTKALCAVGFDGTTEVANAATNNTYMPFGYTTNDATNYAEFYGVRFVVANRGLATQTVQIYSSSSTTATKTPYNASALKACLENATWTAMGSALAYNDGAAAYAIPSSFYIRMPFISNRLRLAGMRAVRIS